MIAIDEQSAIRMAKLYGGGGASVRFGAGQGGS